MTGPLRSAAGRRSKNLCKEHHGMTQEELPNAEREVLACVCRLGSATVRQVREAIVTYRPMTHASVFTLLGRLQAKGLVTRQKGSRGKAFVYKPAAHPDRT